MGVRFLDEKLCNGCGICVRDCPMDVLAMNEAGKAYVNHGEDCWECFFCEIECPVKAIDISPEAVRKLYFNY